MLRLWRISNYADLGGMGGLRFSARWHSKGRPVLYTAEHPAGAMTEMLAHLDRANMPDTFQLIEIEIDETIPVAVIADAQLPANWMTDIKSTRAVGDAWLQSVGSLALRVPSVIVPDAWNVLLNPRHPDAIRMRVVRVQKAPLDSRLR